LRPKRAGWAISVLKSSALTGHGVPELWDALRSAHERLTAEGLSELRAQQGVAWMWSEVTDDLVGRLRTHPEVRALLPELETRVAGGKITASAAAAQMLATFLGR
jgi:LAO/AO transport system kinase